MRKAIRVSVSLDQVTREKLNALADADGRSKSSMVRWLILQAPPPGDGIAALCWPKTHIRPKTRRSGWLTLLGYSGSPADP